VTPTAQPAHPTVADVVAAVHRRYPPDTAESWDAVGLVCGDPSDVVRRILVAVDPVDATVSEALASGYDLLLCHHPLLLRPASSVAATTPTGVLLHRLISGRCALLTAHTNADVARDGVSDALAAVFELVDTEPLIPAAGDPATGLGRVGRLASPVSLEAFAAAVRAALPDTHQGVRVAGDPGRVVARVAVVGGSGADALAAATSAGADVVITSDLKHHAVSDHVAAGGAAVIDVAHVASEGPWVPYVAALLQADLTALGFDVETVASTLVTDPWTAHL
jgi:dinuclear metal center YbgI/SA1388 family protein